METEKGQMEEAEQVQEKEEPVFRMMEREQGLQMDKGLIQPIEEEAEQAPQAEEVLLHGMEKNQGLNMESENGHQEEALHPIEEEQGLQTGEALPTMDADQGLQIEEDLALHRMEADQGLQMEGTLIIHLMEADMAEMRAKTSRMKEKRAEMEAAVEAKRNELELRKINLDRRLAQLLLFQEAEEVFLDILFRGPN